MPTWDKVDPNLQEEILQDLDLWIQELEARMAKEANLQARRDAVAAAKELLERERRK